MSAEYMPITVRRYSWYGFWVGLALGTIAGMTFGGQSFHIWVILLIAGCSIVGAIAGGFVSWFSSKNASVVRKCGDER